MDANQTKTTDELNHEIKDATDIEDYPIENQQDILTCSLSEHLNMLLSQKDLAKTGARRPDTLRPPPENNYI
ncbi:MAG: hypothetical protein NC314_05140 [Roseburia sp.]|nr:hypothetical protein [Roseburia sp.]MCM1242205.1 hypothetical protein [Roseburia sp.]